MHIAIDDALFEILSSSSEFLGRFTSRIVQYNGLDTIITMQLNSEAIAPPITGQRMTSSPIMNINVNIIY